MSKKIIIYGAGIRGKELYRFVRERKKDAYIAGFCDKRWQEIGKIEDKPVYHYKDIWSEDYDFLISVNDKNDAADIEQLLKNDGHAVYYVRDLAELLGEKNDVEFNSRLCSLFHVKAMDQWFEAAEKEGLLGKFWGENTVFFQFFKELDLTNVIELACGRGRHVPKYYDKAGKITLVDILQENIDYCEQRFRGCDKISYYCNNGFNLEKLESEKYTSLFCYDSMVHFEMINIYEYLQDIYRVLKKNSFLLIHHSNNDKDYKASYIGGTDGRAYMSKELFAHIAYRNGFEIVEQKVIDWGANKDLDCVTLLKKP